LRLWVNLLLPIPWIVLLPSIISRAYNRHDLLNAITYSCWLVVSVKALVNGFRSWRRPCYISTDDAGIGITLRKGSCAIRWRDVVGMRAVKNRVRIQTTADGKDEAFAVDLSGYPERTRQEIRDVVITRARLRPLLRHTEQFISSGSVPPRLGIPLSEWVRANQRRLPERASEGEVSVEKLTAAEHRFRRSKQ